MSPETAPPPGRPSARESGSPPRPAANRGDRVFQRILLVGGSILLVLLLAIVLELTLKSRLSFRAFGFGFLTGSAWDPVREHFGVVPFLYGTVVSSIVALLIAVPISLGVAIFLVELAPAWMRGPVGFMVELLAALPSVVYGLWGIFVLVPWLRGGVEPALGKTLGFLPLFSGPNQGFGMLAGGLVLSIMILPTISSVTREVLRAVPNWLREGTLALGTTRWEMIRGTVLPFARSGIIGAIILGLGRALGETMAVTMVIGNRPQVAASLFAPGYTMASVIANEYTEATSDLYLSALTEIGLLLFAVTLVLNVIARLLVWRVARAAAPGAPR